MIERKVYLPDSPGANGLRGGKNIYGVKTSATTAWLDEVGGPAYFNRGFTTAGFISETSYQQEKKTKSPKSLNILESKYGSAINDLIDKPKPSVSELLHDTEEAKDTWLTSSKSDMESTITIIRNSREESIEPIIKSTTKINNNRFVTENQRAVAYCSRNIKRVGRVSLPGTPVPVEKYRQKLIDNYGILAVSMLYESLGENHIISCSQATYCLSSLVPDFSRAGINQILAYFTSDLKISTNNVIRMIIGRVEGFPRYDVEQMFLKFCHHEEQGNNSSYNNNDNDKTTTTTNMSSRSCDSNIDNIHTVVLVSTILSQINKQVLSTFNTNPEVEIAAADSCFDFNQSLQRCIKAYSNIPLQTLTSLSSIYSINPNHDNNNDDTSSTRSFMLTDRGAVLNKEKFVEWHQHMFASDPEDYESKINILWPSYFQNTQSSRK